MIQTFFDKQAYDAIRVENKVGSLGFSVSDHSANQLFSGHYSLGGLRATQ